MVEFFTSYFIFGCVLILCGKPIFAIPPFMDTALKPRLLITLGDVAGIGPEIVAPRLARTRASAIPIVIGDPHWVNRQAFNWQFTALVQVMAHPAEALPATGRIPCIRSTRQSLSEIQPGKVFAGRPRHL